MRATVILLIVANIGCLLWFGWWAPPAKPERPTAGGDLSPIVGRDPADSRCFVLQPPPSLSQGRALAQRLAARAESVDWQPPQTQKEYWVHLPPLDDLADARRAVRALREAGFDNAALATGRGWTNVAVVGVFQQRAQAVDRRDTVRDSGFAARISSRQREVRPGRLTLRAAEPGTAPEGHQWVQRDCAR